MSSRAMAANRMCRRRCNGRVTTAVSPPLSVAYRSMATHFRVIVNPSDAALEDDDQAGHGSDGGGTGGGGTGGGGNVGTAPGGGGSSGGAAAVVGVSISGDGALTLGNSSQ